MPRDVPRVHSLWQARAPAAWAPVEFDAQKVQSLEKAYSYGALKQQARELGIDTNLNKHNLAVSISTRKNIFFPTELARYSTATLHYLVAEFGLTPPPKRAPKAAWQKVLMEAWQGGDKRNMARKLQHVLQLYDVMEGIEDKFCSDEIKHALRSHTSGKKSLHDQVRKKLDRVMNMYQDWATEADSKKRRRLVGPIDEALERAEDAVTSYLQFIREHCQIDSYDGCDAEEMPEAMKAWMRQASDIEDKLVMCNVRVQGRPIEFVAGEEMLPGYTIYKVLKLQQKGHTVIWTGLGKTQTVSVPPVLPPIPAATNNTVNINFPTNYLDLLKLQPQPEQKRQESPRRPPPAADSSSEDDDDDDNDDNDQSPPPSDETAPSPKPRKPWLQRAVKVWKNLASQGAKVAGVVATGALLHAAFGTGQAPATNTKGLALSPPVATGMVPTAVGSMPLAPPPVQAGVRPVNVNIQHPMTHEWTKVQVLPEEKRTPEQVLAAKLADMSAAKNPGITPAVNTTPAVLEDRYQTEIRVPANITPQDLANVKAPVTQVATEIAHPEVMAPGPPGPAAVQITGQQVQWLASKPLPFMSRPAPVFDLGAHAKQLVLARQFNLPPHRAIPVPYLHVATPATKSSYMDMTVLADAERLRQLRLVNPQGLIQTPDRKLQEWMQAQLDIRQLLEEVSRIPDTTLMLVDISTWARHTRQIPAGQNNAVDKAKVALQNTPQIHVTPLVPLNADNTFARSDTFVWQQPMCLQQAFMYADTWQAVVNAHTPLLKKHPQVWQHVKYANDTVKFVGKLPSAVANQPVFPVVNVKPVLTTAKAPELQQFCQNVAARSFLFSDHERTAAPSLTSAFVPAGRVETVQQAFSLLNNEDVRYDIERTLQRVDQLTPKAHVPEFYQQVARLHQSFNAVRALTTVVAENAPVCPVLVPQPPQQILNYLIATVQNTTTLPQLTQTGRDRVLHDLRYLLKQSGLVSQSLQQNVRAQAPQTLRVMVLQDRVSTILTQLSETPDAERLAVDLINLPQIVPGQSDAVQTLSTMGQVLAQAVKTSVLITNTQDPVVTVMLPDVVSALKTISQQPKFQDFIQARLAGLRWLVAWAEGHTRYTDRTLMQVGYGPPQNPYGSQVEITFNMGRLDKMVNPTIQPQVIPQWINSQQHVQWTRPLVFPNPNRRTRELLTSFEFRTNFLRQYLTALSTQPPLAKYDNDQVLLQPSVESYNRQAQKLLKRAQRKPASTHRDTFMAEVQKLTELTEQCFGHLAKFELNVPEITHQYTSRNLVTPPQFSYYPGHPSRVYAAVQAVNRSEPLTPELYTNLMQNDANGTCAAYYNLTKLVRPEPEVVGADNTMWTCVPDAEALALYLNHSSATAAKKLAFNLHENFQSADQITNSTPPPNPVITAIQRNFPVLTVGPKKPTSELPPSAQPSPAPQVYVTPTPAPGPVALTLATFNPVSTVPTRTEVALEGLTVISQVKNKYEINQETTRKLQELANDLDFWRQSSPWPTGPELQILPNLHAIIRNTTDLLQETTVPSVPMQNLWEMRLQQVQDAAQQDVQQLSNQQDIPGRHWLQQDKDAVMRLLYQLPTNYSLNPANQPLHPSLSFWQHVKKAQPLSLWSPDLRPAVSTAQTRDPETVLTLATAAAQVLDLDPDFRAVRQERSYSEWVQYRVEWALRQQSPALDLYYDQQLTSDSTTVNKIWSWAKWDKLTKATQNLLRKEHFTLPFTQLRDSVQLVQDWVAHVAADRWQDAQPALQYLHELQLQIRGVNAGAETLYRVYGKTADVQYGEWIMQTMTQTGQTYERLFQQLHEKTQNVADFLDQREGEFRQVIRQSRQKWDDMSKSAQQQLKRWGELIVEQMRVYNKYTRRVPPKLLTAAKSTRGFEGEVLQALLQRDVGQWTLELNSRDKFIRALKQNGMKADTVVMPLPAAELPAPDTWPVVSPAKTLVSPVPEKTVGSPLLQQWPVAERPMWLAFNLARVLKPNTYFPAFGLPTLPRQEWAQFPREKRVAVAQEVSVVNREIQPAWQELSAADRQVSRLMTMFWSRQTPTNADNANWPEFLQQVSTALVEASVNSHPNDLTPAVATFQHVQGVIPLTVPLLFSAYVAHQHASWNFDNVSGTFSFDLLKGPETPVTGVEVVYTPHLPSPALAEPSSQEGQSYWSALQRGRRPPRPFVVVGESLDGYHVKRRVLPQTAKLTVSAASMYREMSPHVAIDGLRVSLSRTWALITQVGTEQPSRALWRQVVKAGATVALEAQIPLPQMVTVASQVNQTDVETPYRLEVADIERLMSTQLKRGRNQWARQIYNQPLHLMPMSKLYHHLTQQGLSHDIYTQAHRSTLTTAGQVLREYREFVYENFAQVAEPFDRYLQQMGRTKLNEHVMVFQASQVLARLMTQTTPFYSQRGFSQAFTPVLKNSVLTRPELYFGRPVSLPFAERVARTTNVLQTQINVHGAGVTLDLAAAVCALQLNGKVQHYDVNPVVVGIVSIMADTCNLTLAKNPSRAAPDNTLNQIIQTLGPPLTLAHDYMINPNKVNGEQLVHATNFSRQLLTTRRLPPSTQTEYAKMAERITHVQMTLESHPEVAAALVPYAQDISDVLKANALTTSSWFWRANPDHRAELWQAPYLVSTLVGENTLVLQNLKSSVLWTPLDVEANRAFYAMLRENEALDRQDAAELAQYEKQDIVSGWWDAITTVLAPLTMTPQALVAQDAVAWWLQDMSWGRKLQDFVREYTRDFPLALKIVGEGIVQLFIGELMYSIWIDQVDRTFMRHKPLPALLQSMPLADQITAVQKYLPENYQATRQVLTNTEASSVFEVLGLTLQQTRLFLTQSQSNRAQAAVDLLNQLAISGLVRPQDREVLLSEVGPGLFSQQVLGNMRQVLSSTSGTLQQNLRAASSTLTDTVKAATQVVLGLAANLEQSRKVLQELGVIGSKLEQLLKSI